MALVVPLAELSPLVLFVVDNLTPKLCVVDPSLVVPVVAQLVGALAGLLAVKAVVKSHTGSLVEEYAYDVSDSDLSPENRGVGPM